MDNFKQGVKQGAPAVSDVIKNAGQEHAELVQTENNDDTYIIYNNSIECIVEDLIANQFDNKPIEELKHDRSFFPTLVNYVYLNYFGDFFKNKLDYKLQGIKPRYDDIKTIDNIFNIYINLVYKYKWNNRPSITEFALLTGINRNTIMSWLNGDIDNSIINNIVDQDKRRYITIDYSSTVQKWVSTCEQSLVDGNGELVKEIFLLKAVHGFRDQNNTITVEHVVKPVIDADNLPDLIGINGKN